MCTALHPATSACDTTLRSSGYSNHILALRGEVNVHSLEKALAVDMAVPMSDCVVRFGWLFVEPLHAHIASPATCFDQGAVT